MHFVSFKSWRAIVAGICAALAATLAYAAYPDKFVTIVVPFPPGGAGDTLARILSKKMEEQLGKTVIVENKPGAGTAIGAAAVANAKPDGYSLLLSSNSTFTLNPAVQAKLPYDPAKSFEPLAIVGHIALVVLVNAAVPAKNVAELVSAAKASPQKYVYGSFGNGTVSNFAGEMFNAAAGIKMTHVPYKGSAPLITDLIGGQIPVAVDTVVAAAPHVKAGKVRALAVTTDKRPSAMPDVPTLAESGYPGFEISSWVALVAPRGLAPDVKSRLDKALEAAMANPDTVEKMKAAGFEPAYRRVPNWTALVNDDIARMRKVADSAQIKVE
jgi:tripartite-type tricarboxylate transporter receptor subunit TctC